MINLDILKIIESYNICYNKYLHSPMKCILYGNINRLNWLFQNKYPKTLFDKDCCYCNYPNWMDNCNYPNWMDICSHCHYASKHTLLDFAIKENQKKIIQFLYQF